MAVVLNMLCELAGFVYECGDVGDDRVGYLTEMVCAPEEFPAFGELL
jgi:hypothetical protein